MDNVHPGDILREDFLIGSDIPLAEVRAGEPGSISVFCGRSLRARKPLMPPLMRALTRYFGMSEGYFLRLQNCFDIEEVRRREGAELDRIVPRAA